MKVEIKFRSRINESHISEPNSVSDFHVMGDLTDVDASLTKFFERSIPGLKVQDRGISFQCDHGKHLLYCVALFELDKKPSDEQLKQLVHEVMKQMDCGYYGEDGWFVDVGPNSYYIDLIDHSYQGDQPVSVKIF